MRGPRGHDKAGCEQVGCCQYAECPIGDGSGECHSALGQARCSPVEFTSHVDLGLDRCPTAIWFRSSEHCSTSAMQSFGWSVSAPYSGCDASGHGGYYFWHYPGDGHISTSLPTGSSFFSITYGSSCYYRNGTSVQIKLNGVVVDSINNTCADGTAQAGKCDYYPPPVESCLKTFSGAYNSGDVLQVIELSSIAYIMSIVNSDF